jgi:tetratricopeptide (TPR) repeat protein
MADADSPTSSRLFISYRREDSSGHVLALLPALRKHFGADRIFKDTDNIPPGADFLKFIRRELESCSVLLAIIGRDWLTVQDPRLGHRRLDNPEDFLRVEVATALKNERVRVIPVLVERATMPATEDLPPDLAELRYRNAVELSDVRWESDVQLLIEAVERACVDSAAKPEAASQRPELADLHKRRAREIAAHLTDAREALEARDCEAALWACEKALLLDPQRSEALELLDRARSAIDEQKIETALGQARQALSRRDIGEASDFIDQAMSIDNTSQAALTLRKEMLARRRERERERERARVVQAATDRAQASFDEEDFESAARHADDALAVEPGAAKAQNIRSRALAALDEGGLRRKIESREQEPLAQEAAGQARAEAASADNFIARSLLTSATKKLPAAIREFWSTRRARGLGAAAVVIIITTLAIHYYGLTSAPSSQSEAPTISGDPSSRPTSDGRIEPPVPPPDRSPAPESTPPSVTPPVSKSPTKEESTQQRLELFRKTAVEQLRKGQRAQALTTAAAGLQLEPNDPALWSVVDSLLSEAQNSAQRANTRATSAGAATLAQKTFSEAVKLEDEATRYREAKRKVTAIQSFWKAEGRFDLAAQQAANEQARLRQEADAAKKEIDDQQTRIPAEPPPAVNRIGEEKGRIEATLRRYEAAYERLDAAAVKVVFPGAPDDLGRRFASYEFYRIDMYCEKTELSADMATATATCRLGHYFKPKGAKEQQQRKTEEFTLHKRGDIWIIVQRR